MDAKNHYLSDAAIRLTRKDELQRTFVSGCAMLVYSKIFLFYSALAQETEYKCPTQSVFRFW